MKIEHDFQLHRDILKIIEDAEIKQDWIDDVTVLCSIPKYEAQTARDSILDKICEHITKHYVYIS